MCTAANQVECLSIRICYRAQAHNIVEGSFAIDLSASPYNRGLTIDLTPSLCLCKNQIFLKIKFLELPRISRCFVAFQNLETLCYVDNPNLGASRINQFLEACPNLQNLAIGNCKKFSAFNLEAANLKYLYLGFRALIAPNLAGVTLVNPWSCTHGTLLDSSVIKEHIKTLSIAVIISSFALLNSFPDLQTLASRYVSFGLYNFWNVLCSERAYTLFEFDAGDDKGHWYCGGQIPKSQRGSVAHWQHKDKWTWTSFYFKPRIIHHSL